jgi:hypothetical protein
MNLISDLTVGEYGGYQAVLAVHAEGSIEAEKLTILMQYQRECAIHYARWLGGLDIAEWPPELTPPPGWRFSAPKRPATATPWIPLAPPRPPTPHRVGGGRAVSSYVVVVESACHAGRRGLESRRFRRSTGRITRRSTGRITPKNSKVDRGEPVRFGARVYRPSSVTGLTAVLVAVISGRQAGSWCDLHLVGLC